MQRTARRYIDDRPSVAVDHALCNLRSEPERTFEIKGNDLVEHRFRYLVGGNGRRHASIVDEDVETTELLIGGGGEPINVIPPAGVCRDSQGATTEPSHFLSCRLTSIKLATRNDHVGSTTRESAHHL